MLDRTEVIRAVDMQQRSYRLLQWIVSAIKNGFIDVSVAHDYASFPQAMQKWLNKHYLNIPADARPVREDIPTFSEFFGTYLDNSFELLANPGKRRYSQPGSCFCWYCSWIADAPNLKTKKVTSKDKQRAERLKSDALRRLARDIDVNLENEQVAKLLVDESIRENAALLAYAYDLGMRMKGIATGPAILALWRGFAWTKNGSPKPDFELSHKAIFVAEEHVVNAIKHGLHN